MTIEDVRATSMFQNLLKKIWVWGKLMRKLAKKYPKKKAFFKDMLHELGGNLEYLKGEDLNRHYSTLVTKTKATTYELKWIEDLVHKLWSPVVVKYDQHAYFSTSHWGPKRQSFYGYASNLTSSKDVYSRRRIIAVTRLTIMKKYDYGHLEEIEVLMARSIMFGLLYQRRLMRKWSNLDKKMAWVLVQDIDKQLYQRRLMRNLEMFVGGRIYEKDLKLLERTI
ncbi:hypothetical protein Tco_0568406 [Tanacetum coccineum]